MITTVKHYKPTEVDTFTITSLEPLDEVIDIAYDRAESIGGFVTVEHFDTTRLVISDLYTHEEMEYYEILKENFTDDEPI